ncbi:hypothetical protein [Demequina litorisediminis]|uniref:Flagellin N-terminal domain-containing protein n=1 Tax=Demequina litorisediminis TaxID=1849022 RepID=A0ABQ6ID04_9MICO|nr:hypothetical protein [Demequina litorisediminis]GMA35680.1 hypothetical protein GCM10025876_18840 [Demequina litorisediminis]
MISRVTQQTVRTSTLANLQGNLRTMADLQARLSSGKNISKASDDPSATGRTMSLRADYAAATQAKRNADDGVTWLSQTDTRCRPPCRCFAVHATSPCRAPTAES